MFRRLPVLFLLAFAALAVACGSDSPQDTTSITATVLIEPSSDEPQWFRDVEVTEETNGYELLETAVDGQLESQWHAEFNSHFISSILGEAPEGSAFWGSFKWNEDAGRWESMTVGADLYEVQDGDVLGWAIVEYSESNPQFPAAEP